MYVSIESRLSRILGDWTNGGYLLVADNMGVKIYQLKPDTGEVRAIPLHSCRPWALAVDPSNNYFYVVCRKYSYMSSRYLCHIRKITFDGKVNEVIYNATTRGKEHCL